MVTRLAIPEAARVLGISIPTVKRRLKRGALPGEQEPTPSGFRWLVLLESPESPESPAEPSPGDSGGTPREDSPESPAESPESSPMALQAARAAEMARYTRELLEPLHARLEAQAERLGRLEAENEHLRAQLTAVASTNGQAAPPPETPSAPPAEGQTGRSWWSRLWRVG